MPCGATPKDERTPSGDAEEYEERPIDPPHVRRMSAAEREPIRLLIGAPI